MYNHFHYHRHMLDSSWNHEYYYNSRDWNCLWEKMVIHLYFIDKGWSTWKVFYYNSAPFSPKNPAHFLADLPWKAIWKVDLYSSFKCLSWDIYYLDPEFYLSTHFCGQMSRPYGPMTCEDSIPSAVVFHRHYPVAIVIPPWERKYMYKIYGWRSTEESLWSCVSIISRFKYISA